MSARENTCNDALHNAHSSIIHFADIDDVVNS